MVFSNSRVTNWFQNAKRTGVIIVSLLVVQDNSVHSTIAVHVNGRPPSNLAAISSRPLVACIVA